MENGNNTGPTPSGQPDAITGNASNPAASGSAEPSGPQGLLDEKADKYIREVAPIEDLPDDQDQEDMERVIKDGQASGKEAGSNI